jgi:predicted transcriptional regulator
MLLRDESSMKHVYSAGLEEKGTKGQLLNRFIDTMYHGSVGNMMMALLGNEKTSAKDLQQLRELLDGMNSSEPPPGKKK